MSDFHYGGKSLSEKVDDHERVIYRGNGKPGLVTRIEKAEDRIVNLESYNDKRENRLDKKMNIVITTVLGMFATLLVTLILHLVH